MPKVKTARCRWCAEMAEHGLPGRSCPVARYGAHKMLWVGRAAIWKKMAKLQREGALAMALEDELERTKLLDALRQVKEMPDQPTPAEVARLRKLAAQFV